MSETTPIYLGEARLLSWGHTDTRGRTITLQLPEDEPRHPFEGIPTGKEYGQRMQIVCVAMDDHEQPVDAKHAKRKRLGKAALNAPTVPEKAVEPEAVEKPKPLRSNTVATMCKQNRDFQNWLVDTYWTGKEEIGDYDGLLKRALGITSKTEIDSNPDKGDAWERMLTTFKHRHTVRA